ncbi:type II pantothenate kinase [Cytobacillus gottheilii]|uniref:type II pantothenate kinase n=1 Tax=Cytobacillus gottheilii TaxID=859144 RepID=UPI0021492AFF|nr:type II pantothenate kinase [Cytobacillus gottheilii]
MGIDAGATFIKLAYEEKGNLHYKRYPIQEAASLFNWMKMISPHAEVVLTGGGAGVLKNKYFPQAAVLDEFTAAASGAKILHTLHEPFLLINIGTGTSILRVEKGKAVRVSGTAMGGGTFLGLGRLLTGKASYEQLIELALEGDRTEADLLVKDVYGQDEAPLLGELSASNFAKAAFTDTISDEVKMAALVNMIAETIYLLVMAGSSQQKLPMAFIGAGALNRALQKQLKMYAKMFDFDCTFIENGEYSGAIGALYS